ncbi:MAG: RNA polymerase sigma-70 factor [Dehalococcoidia bacterium]
MTRPPDTEHERATAFQEHRALLFSIAYRMLGTVTEAEDAVQETYLRYSTAKVEEVRSPRAFLATVVTRICLDQLKSARARRETYVGPWLPEPLVSGANGGTRTPVDVVEDHESISMAFLVLLETLTPVERAVFLLHEVFDYGYDEVAGIVGRSEAACRQILHRAKGHVVARRPRFESTDEERERLVRSFLAAVEVGDVNGLMGLLAEDATLWSDGGGKRGAALKPIHGPDRIVRLFQGLLGDQRTPGTFEFALAEVNGRAGAILFLDGEIFAASCIEADRGKIQQVWVVVNPDKLARIEQTGRWLERTPIKRD